LIELNSIIFAYMCVKKNSSCYEINPSHIDSMCFATRKTDGRRDTSPILFLTAPLGISAKEAKELLRANPLIKEVPIVDEQGRIRHKLTKLNILHYEAMAKYKFDTTPHAGVAIGVSNTEDMIKRTEAAVEAGASFITFETAHAYRRDVVRKFQKNFMPTIAEAMSPAEEVEAIKAQAKDIRAVIKHMKAKYKDRSILIGFGTVTSPEAVRLLAALGVDVVKVGIGGGSQCTTFDATGVGGPPFRYFWDCGKAAAALGIQIMADGGIDRRRRTSMLAGIDGLGLQQFGTWYGGTAEAASPAILNDKTGKWEKEARGSPRQQMCGQSMPHSMQYHTSLFFHTVPTDNSAKLSPLNVAPVPLSSGTLHAAGDKPLTSSIFLG
jgi:IMP dehydrogenase/GMP reductase